MITKKVKVAGKYSDITLGEYVAWHNAGSSEILKVMAATGLTKTEARNLERKKFDFILTKFQEALDNPTREDFRTKITLAGKDYGLIPDFTKMRTGEYIDAVSNASSDKGVSGVPKLMSILYRPIDAVMGSKYSIEKYNSDVHLQNAELFKQLPMTQVDGVLLFFSTISNELQVNLELSSVRMIQKLMKPITSKSTSISKLRKRLKAGWLSGVGMVYSKRQRTIS